MYVKAYDAAGNSVVDSEDVYFKNGNHDPSPVIHDNEPPLTHWYLGQNYPCRFSTHTTIRYHVPYPSPVSLFIYDLSGREVRALVSGIHARGSYRVQWDGTNTEGANVSAGAYLYRMAAKEYISTKKMHYIK